MGAGLTTGGGQAPPVAEATLSAQLAAEVAAVPPSSPPGKPAAPAPTGGPSFQRLFLRTTADGVAVRAYLVDPAPAFICQTGHVLFGSLSDAGAVTSSISAVPDGPVKGALEVVGAGAFGQREGTPAVWVELRTGDGVARVRASFSDGHVDEMAPVDHLAVLAQAQSGYSATLTALATDGTSIASIDFPQPGWRPSVPECRPGTSSSAPSSNGAAATWGGGAPTTSIPPGAAADQARPSPAAPPSAATTASFGAYGVLKAVGTDSLTMQIQGPSSMAGQTIVVSVPAGTPVSRNGQPSSLSALQVGDQVGVMGIRSASGYTAQRIQARSAPASGATQP